MRFEHWMIAVRYTYRLGVKPATAEIVEDTMGRNTHTISMGLNAQKPMLNRRYPDAPGFGA